MSDRTTCVRTTNAPSVRGKTGDELMAHAAKLYPMDRYLQSEWVRAVDVVRATKEGWRLDHPVARL